MNKKKISIIGTGAIGGYYGVILADLGHDVHFLLHTDYAYVKENGLLLESKVHKDIIFPNVNAYKNATDMPVSDIVLVCLKTTQNDKILPHIIPYVANENSIVILIQNGLGIEEDLYGYFPRLQIAGAAALIGVKKEKQGPIVHESYGSIDFGSYNVKDISKLQELALDLNSIGISSSLQDLKHLRWKKLVWNMTFNGLTTVFNTTTDKIITEHLQICKIIMQEVIKGADACRIKIPDSFADELIPFTAKMDNYSPSMKLDYDNNRPLELEYMYDRPILEAKAAGYEMVETIKLYKELLKLQK